MTPATGTLASALRIVTEITSPLLRELQTEASARALLATLGVNVPNAPSSLLQLRGRVQAMADAFTAFEAEVDAGNEGSISAVLKMKAVAEASEALFGGINALASELRNELADPALLAEVDFDRVVKRLVHYLTMMYARGHFPVVYNALHVCGIFEVTPVPASGDFTPEHVMYEIRSDRLKRLVKDPAVVAGEVYGWGSDTFLGHDFLKRFQHLWMSLGFFPRFFLPEGEAGDSELALDAESELRLPLYSETGEFGELRFGFALGTIAPSAAGTDGGLALRPFVSGGSAQTFELREGLALAVQGDFDLSGGVALTLRPPLEVDLVTGTAGGGGTPSRFAATVSWAREDGTRVRVASQPNWFLLDAGGFQGALLATLNPQGKLALGLEVGVIDGLARIGGGDGFLQRIMPPDGITARFDLVAGWSLERGIYFKGTAGLELTIPVHASILGVLTVESIFIAARTADTGAIDVVLTGTFATKLGPISGVVEEIGARATITFPEAGGNLGRANAGVAYEPPKGVGLAIDATAVVGGGYLFFDAAKEEYAGILQLEFEETITLTAIGLLTTRMPDGSKGFSLLLIISAEDFTPIQLGYGFTLNGVGGLLGINRTVVVDVLRAGIKNRTLDSVLFPEDPIRNAPQIISNLRAVFPPAENRYVFGPMAIIGWGTPTMVTIELGIVLEFPAPVRLVILGQVRAFLPDPQLPLVTLKMDALGVIDFDKGDASVDATLYDSRLIQYVLTGDMALRANWGASPTFALAVGGLHPRFQPPPNFPKLDRIAVSLATGDNPRLRLESYLALTSNTAQIGARLELYAKEGGFNIEGWVGFDALFHFQPFQFVADVGGRVTVRKGGHKITSVGLDMTLTGPKPWHARGKATFEVLSMKHSVRFDARLGQEESLPLPAPVDVATLLREAARDVRNWSGQIPKDSHPLVSVRRSGDSNGLLVHPQSELVFRQRVVPLNLTISKFGNTAPSGERFFALREVKLNGAEAKPTPVTEHFAPAQFLEMNDDEKLSRPSFEPLEAGIRFGTDSTHCKKPVRTPIEYETIVVDPKKAGPGEAPETYPLPAKHLPALALTGAAGRAAFRRTGKARYRAAGPRIAVSDGIYVVATTDSLTKKPIPGLEEGKAITYTKAAEALRDFIAAHPEQRASLQIVRDMTAGHNA
jgi:hypothetical protein